jgi:hypothetical protein
VASPIAPTAACVGPSAGALSERKASFFERCGKAITKKKSFWKKKKEEKEK